MGAGVVFVWEV